MSRLLLGVDVAALRRWSDEFVVALRGHDFRGAGETNSPLEPRHPLLRSVAPCRERLDSTLWNVHVKCRLGRRIEFLPNLMEAIVLDAKPNRHFGPNEQQR